MYVYIYIYSKCWPTCWHITYVWPTFWVQKLKGRHGCYETACAMLGLISPQVCVHQSEGISGHWNPTWELSVHYDERSGLTGGQCVGHGGIRPSLRGTEHVSEGPSTGPLNILLNICRSFKTSDIHCMELHYIQRCITHSHDWNLKWLTVWWMCPGCYGYLDKLMKVKANVIIVNSLIPPTMEMHFVCMEHMV